MKQKKIQRKSQDDPAGSRSSPDGSKGQGPESDWDEEGENSDRGGGDYRGSRDVTSPDMMSRDEGEDADYAMSDSEIEINVVDTDTESLNMTSPAPLAYSHRP